MDEGQKKVGPEKQENLSEFDTISVPDHFDQLALKILIDHLHGNDEKFSSLLCSMYMEKDLALVHNILELCDYYGVAKVLIDASKHLESFCVFGGFLLAQILEKIPFYKKLAESIKFGCSWALVLQFGLETPQAILDFLVEYDRDSINRALDLCLELDPFKNRTTFRLSQKWGENGINFPAVILPAGGFKWQLEFSLSKEDSDTWGDNATLTCKSFSQPLMENVEISLDFECLVFKPADWSCHNLFQEEGVVITNTARSSFTLCLLDSRSVGYADFIKDDYSYFEVTLHVKEAKGLPVRFEVTEDELAHPFPEFSYPS